MILNVCIMSKYQLWYVLYLVYIIYDVTNYFDMNIVLYRGTILDRIDYNMEQVVETTKRGVDELIKVFLSRKFLCLLFKLCKMMYGCEILPINLYYL